MKHPSRRRCWLRSSLRTMLLCQFLAACAVAVYVHLQQRGERLEEYVYRELMTNRRCSTDALSISVAGVDGRKLIRPTISSEWQGKTTTIVADAAWITDVATDGKRVVFRCRHATVDSGNAVVAARDILEFALPTYGD